MGRGKKRKSQEGASLTTLLPSPHISPDRTSLFALNPPLFLGSQFRERKPIFVVRFDSAFPPAFLSKRNFWLFRQDQEKSATAAVSYPKPHCRLLPSLCVSQDWNNRGHKTGGGYRESTKPKNRTLAPPIPCLRSPSVLPPPPITDIANSFCLLLSPLFSFSPAASSSSAV